MKSNALKTWIVPIRVIGGSKKGTTDDTDGHRYYPLPARMVTVMVCVLVAGCAGIAAAQAPRREPLDSSAEDSAALVEQYTKPLLDRLPLELHFLTEVCELNDDQIAVLQQHANHDIGQLRDELSTAPARHDRDNSSQNALFVQTLVAGVPPGFCREALRTPAVALRKELARAIADAWPDAAMKFDSEVRRLNAYRKRAGARAKVCDIDAVLLLSEQQRMELCEQLMLTTTDDWWQTANRGPAGNDPGEQLLAAVAHGSLCTFLLSAVEWQKVLRPVQLSRYQELWGSRTIEIVFIRAPTGTTREIRRGTKPAELEHGLTAHLNQWVDEIDSACQLTSSQREKLLLAGKLDIEAFKAHLPPLPQELAEGEKLLATEVPAASGKHVIPWSVLTSQSSHFQRSLQGRLTEVQKHSWAALEGERRTFQRQAVVAAVVAGFERAASLAPQQCESLAAAVEAALTKDDLDDPVHWQLAYLRRIAELPEAKWRSWFAELQWPFAREQHLQLAEIVRRHIQ